MEHQNALSVPSPFLFHLRQTFRERSRHFAKRKVKRSFIGYGDTTYLYDDGGG